MKKLRLWPAALLAPMAMALYFSTCVNINLQNPAGSTCIANENLSNSGDVMGQIIKIEAGKQYVFEAKVYGNGAFSLVAITYHTPAKWGWTDYPMLVSCQAEPEWKWVSGTFSPTTDNISNPNGDYFTLYSTALMCLVDWGSGGKIYVEEMRCYDAADPNKTNIFKNPRFTDTDAKAIKRQTTSQGRLQLEIGIGEYGVWYLDWSWYTFSKLNVPDKMDSPPVIAKQRMKYPSWGPEPPLPPISPGDAVKRMGMFVWDRNPNGVFGLDEFVGFELPFIEDFKFNWSWDEYDNPAQIDAWRPWKEKRPNGRLVISIPPFSQDADGLDQTASWQGPMSLSAMTAFRKAAAGDYNQHYATIAQNLINAGFSDAIIRFGHEMDGNWYIYSISTGYSEDEKREKQQLFVEAWRQFVNTLRQIPGQHFQFAWNPSLAYLKEDALLRAYPGDDYVDYIAPDIYDHYFPEIYDYYYHYVANAYERRARNEKAWDLLMNSEAGIKWFLDLAKQHKKQFAIPEWGLYYTLSTGVLLDGGCDPYFIRQMLNLINDTDAAFNVFFNCGENGDVIPCWNIGPTVGAEFLNYLRPEGAPPNYPYNLLTDYLSPDRPCAPALPPDKVLEELGRTGTVKTGILYGRDAEITGDASFYCDLWAYAGEVLGGLYTRTSRPLNQAPTALTFRNVPAAQRAFIVCQQVGQEVGPNPVKHFGLYINGIRVASLSNPPHDDRGWMNAYSYITLDNINLPAGADIKLQTDAEDAVQNTDDYNPLGIDYIYLYNDN